MRYLLTSLLLAIVVLSSGCDPEELEYCGDLVSHEGYDYSTVLIGDQCWFSENCRYLPEVSPSSEGSETEPYYYVYDYEGTDVAAAQATENYAKYGVLYNWPAVMETGWTQVPSSPSTICPSGWRIPSHGEFTQLTDFLGGESVAGYAMKSISGWVFGLNPPGNGSNSSGFNGLPGGSMTFSTNGFGQQGSSGIWWSSSDSGFGQQGAWGPNSYRFGLSWSSDNVDLNNVSSLDIGYSARCVRNY